MKLSRTNDMSAEKTSSTDLVLRKLGGSGDNSVIPVSAKSLNLAETMDPMNPLTKVECFVCRDENGAVVQRLAGDVCVNDQPIQNQRLQSGDRIKLGNCMYEVSQLGNFCVDNCANDATREFSSQPDLSFDRQSNVDLEQGAISSRFEKIETELVRQTDNLSDINKRFDSLTDQISTLINVVSGSAIPTQLETTPNHLETTPNHLETNTTEPAVSTCNIESLGCQEPVTGNFEDSTTAPVETFVDDNVSGGQEIVSELAVEPFVEPDDNDIYKERTPDETEAFVESQPTGLVNSNVADSNVGQDVPDPVEIECESTGDEIDDKLEFLSRLNALTGANEQESAVGEQAQERLSDETTVDQPGFIDADEIESSVASETVMKTNMHVDADGTLDRLLSSLTSSDLPQNETGLATIDSNISAVAATELQDEPRSTECTEQSAESCNQETSQPENQMATAQPETDSNELESLFASLREKDQRSFEDTNQPETDSENGQDQSQMEPVASDSLVSFDTQLSPQDSADQMERLDSVLNSLTTQSNNEIVETEPAPVVSESPSQENNQQDSVSDVLARLQAMQGMQESSNENVTEHPVQESPIFESDPSPMSTALLSEEPSPMAAVAVMPDEAPQQMEISVPEIDDVDVTSCQTIEEPLPDEIVMTPEKTGGENSDDVQNYMNSLLSRLNGQRGTVTPQPKSEPAPTVAATAPESVDCPEPVSEETENIVEPVEQEEFAPKRVAPERNSNLAAMRERANAYSRGALKASELKRKKAQGNSLLIGAAGSVVGAVTTSALSQATGDIFFCLSIVLFLVTTVCSGIYVRDNLLGVKGIPVESTSQPNSDSTGVTSIKDKLLAKLSRDPEVEA